MTKLLKSAFLLIAILFQLFFTSCLKNEGDERTQELENSEISKFILLLTQTGSDIDTTASGMYYITHQNGTGELAQEGDTCLIEYVGYFIDGSIFDASASYNNDGIVEFIYKNENSIDGFEEAIGMLKPGSEATFIIPSKLAYGDIWYDFIPPYTPIVYDINLHEIKAITTE